MHQVRTRVIPSYVSKIEENVLDPEKCGQISHSGKATSWSFAKSSPSRNRTLTLLTHSTPASVQFEHAGPSVSPARPCEITELNSKSGHTYIENVELSPGKGKKGEFVCRDSVAIYLPLHRSLSTQLIDQHFI